MKKLLLLLLFITGTLYAQPPIAQPNDLIVCDGNGDGFEAFDLTTNEAQTLNGLNPTLYDVRYFNTLNNAQNNTSAIVSEMAYTNSSNPQTIFVRVEEISSGLYSITNFDLIVNLLPTASIGSSSPICTGDSASLTINGTPNATVQYTVDGGAMQSIVLDAAGTSFLSFANLTVDTTICLVDVSSSTTPACTQTLTACETIVVNQAPVIVQPNDMIVYENPFDGSATFDLTQNEAIIANGATGLSFQYYLTLADAQAGTNAIPNQSTFANTSNPQTIFVIVVDNASGCFSVTNFDLQVLDSNGIVYIPDPVFKSKLLSANSTNTIAQISGVGYTNIDTNLDGEIQFSEAALITALNLSTTPGSIDKILDFTGINSFVNLESFSSAFNNATININGLTSLHTFSFRNNFSTANPTSVFSNLPSLVNFYYQQTSVSSIVINNCPNVQKIWAQQNSNLTSLTMDSMPALKQLWAWSSSLLTINIPNSPVLEELDLHSNFTINSVSIGNSPLLKILDLSGNAITDVSGFSNNLSNIEQLRLNGNIIPNLILPVSMPNLTSISFNGTSNNNLNFANSPNLQGININAGDMSIVDLTNVPLLYGLTITENPITVLNLSNNNQINSLSISGCPISVLDLSNLSNLTNASFLGLLITELDLSNNPLVSSIRFHDNPNLTHVNLKSGVTNTINYNTSQFYNVPNLEYICIDEGDVINYSILQDPPLIPTSSYCSFTPGGDYNTITGITQFDINGNGCDVNDMLVQYFGIGINLNATSTNSSVFSNGSGNYSVFTNQIGTFDLTPNLENPSYFSVNPNPATVNISVIDNSTTTQNFCITANGVHPDLEIVIAPITPARPGFDAVYKIVYKNKGNQTVDGFVNFTYNDALLDLVSSSVTPTNVGNGSMNWFVSGLVPFQTGSIIITMNVNSPQETPAVNIGDILAFNAFIDVTTDDNWNDNNFDFNQTVVGSYDPNDITCIEGVVVSPSYIGQYLHYVINFENTGTYQAENIVVKTTINPADFDINTLRLLEASHNVTTRVNGDIVEFIFQTINLDTGGHGNVLLKIRTKDELIPSDMVSKKADIYFDYNFPIETNFANTTFQVLSNSIVTIDNSVGIYPNPTNDFVNIKANSSINSVEIFDVQGRIIQKKITNVENETIDVSGLTNGIYFMMIKTEKGQKVEKLVKE